MKSWLLLSLTTLFFAEEPSYNFGGHYSKGSVTLTIDVRDGSYWATFTDKSDTDSLSCHLSAKASVKKGNLRVQLQPGQRSITLLIRPANHTNTMLIRGLRKSDQADLMYVCPASGSLAGPYIRLP